ncbi:complex I NDUFA9 subunit family protein [Paucibacter sediminis]|uniref:Complex I NDUFA9 subunit family protein n=1 Tax=Paucibacter sediminis TaxID=3019553 RepID=A0AA95SR00_9BURK|nr:complex I NDUFA9 subunit family protein [Paucibacter sp. S2-9]WIT14075.1 complex I NDUFA9 subunit family protein [Paucibacter sp. S2-9]
MTPNKILILGGSGFVGRALCEQLVRQHGGAAAITVPSRRPAAHRGLQVLPGLDMIEADVHDAAQLTQLLRGQDLVVNLVAILQGDEAAFERAHVQLPRTLAAACREASVRRLIHVSALGVGPAAPSRYLRSKTRGEAVLQEAAAELDLTLLRPSVIFGADDQFLNLFAALQAWFPLMPLAGADAQFQPVWVEDVAAAILRCMQDRGTIGKTYELAGPQVLRLGELVKLAGRLSGHERRVLPLPAVLAKAQALLMESLPGEPMMSRDNLASMEVPNIASGTLPGLAELGIQAHAVEPIAAAYLRHGVSKMDVLRRGAHR